MELRVLKEEIMDFIFPASLYCICCGNVIDKSRSYSLCDHCMMHVHWNLSPPDIGKGRVDADIVPMLKCADYGIYERSIIFALKYDNHKYIARTIAEIMKDRILKELENPDSPFDSLMKGERWIIVPVPLHKKRMSERGYNHAELISDFLSKELNAIGIKVSSVDLLERIRETRPMKNLGPEEREKNIRGSIRVRENAADLINRVEALNRVNPLNEDTNQNNREFISKVNVLLIDDFYTTGSTARECARALRRYGIRGRIGMLAFAAR